MKPEQDDEIDTEGDRTTPRASSVERLQPPEIVGQVDNPMREGLRRLWWRAFDRLCYCIVLTRFWIFDRIHAPEPPTPADLHREADHERLLRAFPVVAEAIAPTRIRSRAKSGR